MPEQGFGWIPDAPDNRDYLLSTVHPELAFPTALPDAIDWRSLITTVRNQGPIGACTAFATLKAFEFVAKKRSIPFVDGSELLEYYETRKLLGPQYIDVDSGGMIRDAIKVAANLGIASESAWPYDTNKFKQAPPSSAYTDALKHKAIRYVSVPNDPTQIKSVLAAGYPVIIGMTVYENYSLIGPNGQWPMPSGKPVGGHAMTLVGYNDSRSWWIAGNSWSEMWGDHGYGYIPYNYLQANGSDFWMIEDISGAAPAPPSPDPLPNPEDISLDDLYELINKKLGVVSGIDVNFSNGETWPLAIQPPRS